MSVEKLHASISRKYAGGLSFGRMEPHWACGRPKSLTVHSSQLEEKDECGAYFLKKAVKHLHLFFPFLELSRQIPNNASGAFEILAHISFCSFSFEL